MKYRVLLFILGGCLILRAQSVEELKTQIASALRSVNEKRYSAAGLQLRQAMTNLSLVMGHEVLGTLPPVLRSMKPDKNMDRVIPSGVAGGGTIVQRSFTGEGKRVFINLTLQSQSASSMTAMLNNPALTQALGEQKVVMIGKRKGLLKFNRESKSGEVQVMSGQNMLVITADGVVESEAGLTDLASTIDLDKIDAMTGY